MFRVLSEREREVLFSDGDGWVDAFLKLLQKLKCRRPYGRLMNEEQTLSALQWLVAEALSVRYAEDGTQIVREVQYHAHDCILGRRILQ